MRSHTSLATFTVWMQAGPDEAQGQGPQHFWPIDRHSRIDPSALGRALDAIASVDGDRQRYARLAAGWGHYYNDDGTAPRDHVDTGLAEKVDRLRGIKAIS